MCAKWNVSCPVHMRFLCVSAPFGFLCLTAPEVMCQFDGICCCVFSGHTVIRSFLLVFLQL